MIELFYYEGPDSICSNRVIMTLAEKGIEDWIPHKLNLEKGEQFTKEYLEINPKAQVPTLVHNDNIIRESSIICNYIDEIKETRRLKPTDPAGRAHIQEWIKESDESGYQATASINFVSKFRLEVPREIMEERWKRVTDIERLHRQKSCVLDGFKSPYVLRAVGMWDRIFTKIEMTLSDNQPWIGGKEFSLIETNYAPFIKVLDILNILDIWLKDRPYTLEWWNRIKARPSYQLLDMKDEQIDTANETFVRAGSQVADNIKSLLDEYRNMF